jgi:hypothetical protein
MVSFACYEHLAKEFMKGETIKLLHLLNSHNSAILPSQISAINRQKDKTAKVEAKSHASKFLYAVR